MRDLVSFSLFTHTHKHTSSKPSPSALAKPSHNRSNTATVILAFPETTGLTPNGCFNDAVARDSGSDGVCFPIPFFYPHTRLDWAPLGLLTRLPPILGRAQNSALVRSDPDCFGGLVQFRSIFSPPSILPRPPPKHNPTAGAYQSPPTVRFPSLLPCE